MRFLFLPGAEFAGCVVSSSYNGGPLVELRCGCGTLFRRKKRTIISACRDNRKLVCEGCQYEIRSKRAKALLLNATNKNLRKERPKNPKTVEAISLLQQGKSLREVSKTLKVSVQTVNVWWLRWIVYPEWVELKTKQQKKGENDAQ